MGNDDNHSLNNYSNAFNNFFNYVNVLHSEPNNKDKVKEGYFVNLNKYQELIKKINECIQTNQNSNQYGRNAALGQVNFDKLKTVSLKEVTEKINGDNSFIIINEDLFKVICDKKKQPIYKITYKITPENNLLVKENELQIQFRNDKNNIISKATILRKVENNDNKINNNPSQIPHNNYENKLYESLKIYSENERDIISKLNINSENIYQGFLVDNIWIEKWKMYSNYNNVIKLFQTNNNNEDVIKNSIRQELLNKNLNFNNLDYIDKYILKDANQLKMPITANKAYVLLNAKFINLFINNQKDDFNLDTFYLSFHKVDIKINKIPFISFQTNSNVIFNRAINYSSSIQIPAQVNPNINQTNNLYQSEFLKHLIRLTILKREIKALNALPHKTLNRAYIVRNEIITNLKKKFELNKVVTEDLNNLLNNVTYANADQYYPQISKILYEKNIGYINNIKQLETTGAIQFSEKEKNLKLNSQSNFLYIDNIEIIDENFAIFLNQKFNNSINMLLTYYTVTEEKILLIINLKQTYIFEIASLNQNNGDITIEYLMEVKYISRIQNINIANYIFNILVAYGIKKLMSIPNPIMIENNILITFHPINNNFGQGLNIENIKNNSHKNINNLPRRNIQRSISAQNTNVFPRNFVNSNSLSRSVYMSNDETMNSNIPNTIQKSYYL